jgi:hypothetical protein
MRLRIGRKLLLLVAAGVASACGAPRPLAACAPHAAASPPPSAEPAATPCASPPPTTAPAPSTSAASASSDMRVAAFDCAKLDELPEKPGTSCAPGKSTTPSGLRTWHSGGPEGSAWNADALGCGADIEVPCRGTLEVSVKVGRAELSHARLEHAADEVSCRIALPRKRWEAELDRSGPLPYRTGVFRAEAWVECDDPPPIFFHAEDAFVAGFADGE